MASFTSPDNFELGLITEDITTKTTYYAKAEGTVIKIYKDAASMPTAPAQASAASGSLFDLVTDAITSYEMCIDLTPDDAVPFYVITGNLSNAFTEYKINDNPPTYVLPSLTPVQIETKVAENQVAKAAAEAKQVAEAAEKQRVADEAAEQQRLAEAEQQRRAETEQQRLAEAEQQRLADEEQQRLADEAAKKQRLADEEAAKKQTASLTPLPTASSLSSAAGPINSSIKRRGFPNYGSSCWALSIIHLFYDTTDFREHILNYNIPNAPEIFNMDIKTYIGIVSGNMLTQYYIDKLQTDNNELFKKMEPLFNTNTGEYKNIRNIQSVWGFPQFRDAVLKILDNNSITDKSAAIQTAYVDLTVSSNDEKELFKNAIAKIKGMSDKNTKAIAINNIFIYAFQTLFKYTTGEDIEPDTLIKALFVIPLIIFDDFGQQDNTEFIDKLSTLCEITINLITYNSKSKEEQTFYIKDPSTTNYIGDLIGIKKHFSITEKEQTYYYDGKNCTDTILSSKESFIYSLRLGVASEYKNNESVFTYLNKSNPVPNGSFFLPDEADFNKNNPTHRITYSVIKKNFESQIRNLNDKKWEILKTKFNIPTTTKNLQPEIHESKLRINIIMTDLTKFQTWLTQEKIAVVIPEITVNSNVNFKFFKDGLIRPGVVTQIVSDNYTISYNDSDGNKQTGNINKSLVITPSIQTLWNDASAEYRNYENTVLSNQCQKENQNNFKAGKYLCASIMRKAEENGNFIETIITLNPEITIDSKLYRLVGATIYEGGHYYYDSIQDNLKLNDETVDEITNDMVTVKDEQGNDINQNEKEYIATHWSMVLYERVDTPPNSSVQKRVAPLAGRLNSRNTRNNVRK